METLRRSFNILRTLGQEPDGIGVKELSERLRIPASTTHRILSVLMDEGFAVQESASRKYELGPEALFVARLYLQRRNIVVIAEPFLARLREQTDETVFLTSLVGDRPICVAIEHSTRALRFFIEIGQIMPYHAAASARAILAFMPRDEARRRLMESPLTKYTKLTPTSIPQILSLLEEERRSGVSVCDEQLDEQVTAIAAPVFGPRGEATASMAMVAPSHRLTDQKRTRAIRLVCDTARQLSEALAT